MSVPKKGGSAHCACSALAQLSGILTLSMHIRAAVEVECIAEV